MIRITVEMLPGGDESKKHLLADADIFNDGSGSPWLASYGFRLRGANGRVMRAGHVGEFKRAQFHVWWLIAAVLLKAFPGMDRAFRDREIRATIK